jgi:hypothetical protein
MITYTYTEARQNFASILKKAKKEGKVYIKRRDGTLFELKPVKSGKSPLDVKGIKSEITKEEILSILKEVREK